MGKYYEDLDTLIQLIKKIDKKNQLAEFIIRVARNAQKTQTNQYPMSSKKQKKNSINKGHYLELMDRLHIVMMNIQEHIIEHPLTLNEKDIQKKVEKAQHKLWEAYQLVGNKEDSYENENNAH